MLRKIVLDFDGTIASTSVLKEQFYSGLIAELGIKESDMQNFLLNDTLGRKQKFEKLQGHLSLKAEFVAQCYEKFAGFMKNHESQVQVATGFSDFLQRSRDIELIILSAAPRAEIVETLHRLKLAEHFAQAIGDSLNKSGDLAQMKAQQEGADHDLVFIGDSEGDLKSAQLANIRFMGYVEFNQKLKKPSKPCQVYDNYFDVALDLEI